MIREAKDGLSELATKCAWRVREGNRTREPTEEVSLRRYAQSEVSAMAQNQRVRAVAASDHGEYVGRRGGGKGLAVTGAGGGVRMEKQVAGTERERGDQACVCGVCRTKSQKRPGSNGWGRHTCSRSSLTDCNRTLFVMLVHVRGGPRSVTARACESM